MVIAAIAAKSDRLSAKGYLQFDDTIFSDLSIDLTQTEGDSFSERANKERHYDAFLGGVNKRVSLSKSLINQVTPNLIPRPEMKRNLNALKMSGFITEVNPKLDIELQK